MTGSGGNPVEVTANVTHLSHPKYRPDIDGLRAVAVLSVVAFHAFPGLMKGGFIGVDVFFVISGFLISTIIFENLEKGTFSFAEFYARRIRRIFPALVLVLLASLVFGWLVLIPDELNQLGKHVAAGAGFISNFVLWGEAGYFDNSAESKPLLHLWSLGIEEQFYIVWPLLLWLAWKKNFNLLTIIVLVAIISFYLNVKSVKPDPVATFYSPQTRFWELLAGSILAWLVLYQKEASTGLRSTIDRWFTRLLYRETVPADGTKLPGLLSFVGCLLLAYGFFRIHQGLSFPGKWAMVPVLGASFVILAGPNTWINRTILSNRLAVWFGLISFPLYLWHWPILSFARIIEGDVPARGLRIAGVLLSILLAWMTVTFVEKHFRFGHARVRLKVFLLCGAMVALGVTGFVVSKRDFTESHGYQDLLFKRKGFEYAIGSSLSWFKGKDDWLFLGNAFDQTVAKLRLAIVPGDEEIERVTQSFSNVAKVASDFGIKAALIVGPNKSSIYPEYLPDGLASPKKYSSFFLDKLREIPDLTVYDPTQELLAAKASEGLLYWMTDTHWNNKGAFLTYAGFCRKLGLPVPGVTFKRAGKPHSGDLIRIGKLKDFPLHTEDNWETVWPEAPVWVETEIPNEEETSFGAPSIVVNRDALSRQTVWVVGDSFAGSL